MKGTAPLSAAFRRLREADLRPTRQRLALAQLLLQNGDRHVTAEQLHGEAVASGIPVSLATVYNTLHQIHRSGAAARDRRAGAVVFRHQHGRSPSFLL